jgi:hypothetical protein
MPISDGMGLVFSVTGYNDTIVISFTGCAEQLPDPDVLAQCLRDSFQEYLALAQRTARRKPRTSSVGPQQLSVSNVTPAKPKRTRRKAQSPVTTA